MSELERLTMKIASLEACIMEDIKIIQTLKEKLKMYKNYLRQANRGAEKNFQVAQLAIYQGDVHATHLVECQKEKEKLKEERLNLVLENNTLFHENKELKKKLHDIQADAVTIQAMNLGVDTVMEWKRKATLYDCTSLDDFYSLTGIDSDDYEDHLNVMRGWKEKAEKWDKLESEVLKRGTCGIRIREE
jgi:hypothetical protein